MSTKNESPKPTETTKATNASTDAEKDAPKVRARRLSTSLRAGLAAGDGDPPPADGGDGVPLDGTDTGGRSGPIDGNYITYGSLNTWSCRG